MTKIISHRANLNGPASDENTLGSILRCLQEYNFDVEIDVWVLDNLIHIGHDLPSKFILDIQSFLFKFIQYKDRIWLHCKNIEAAVLFSALDIGFNFFGHSSDEFVLTSKGFIFTKPDVVNKNAIVVMPELVSSKIEEAYFNTKGILTDYPIQYEAYYNTIRS